MARRDSRPRNPAPVVCIRCGMTVFRWPSAAATQRFCSKSCARRSCAPSGPAMWNWKGGASPRTSAAQRAIEDRKREVGACERCGSTDNLQGHHRLAHADYPEFREDKNNIEVLCADCHAEEHPELAPVIRVPRPPRVLIACAECRTERSIQPHLVGKAKFCSKLCQRAAIYRSRRERALSQECQSAQRASQPEAASSGADRAGPSRLAPRLISLRCSAPDQSP